MLHCLQRVVCHADVLRALGGGTGWRNHLGNQQFLWVFEQLQLLQLAFNPWEKTFQLAWSRPPTRCWWQSLCCKGIRTFVSGWMKVFRYSTSIKMRNLTMNGEAAFWRCNYPKRLPLLPPWVLLWDCKLCASALNSSAWNVFNSALL